MAEAMESGGPLAKDERAASWGETQAVEITINRLAINDLSLAVEKGFEDFGAERGKSLMLGAFFVFGGLFFITMLYALRMLVLFNPFLFALAFLGPFFAAGFYEISRRRESSERVATEHVLKAISSTFTRGESYAAMGLVSVGLFVLWMAAAALLYLAFIGPTLLSFSEFANRVVASGSGWFFVMLGNLIGLIFLTLIFTVSAFSFQLLYEYNRIGVSRAISASIDAVTGNPLPMLIWAALISFCMLLSFATGFIPLIVVVPLLGYTAWHLYRKTISVSPIDG